jgi:hypothetical protein
MSVQSTPERRGAFTTLSGEPVRPLYGPEDVGPFEERVGFTEGELVSALQDVWGSYTETPVF